MKSANVNESESGNAYGCCLHGAYEMANESGSGCACETVPMSDQAEVKEHAWWNVRYY